MDDFMFPDGYDGVMIECKDMKVTIKSVVCISPFNTETKDWLMGLMLITVMKNVLSQTKYRIVSKDSNVEKFLDKYYKNRNKYDG